MSLWNSFLNVLQDSVHAASLGSIGQPSTVVDPVVEGMRKILSTTNSTAVALPMVDLATRYGAVCEVLPTCSLVDAPELLQLTSEAPELLPCLASEAPELLTCLASEAPYTVTQTLVDQAANVTSNYSRLDFVPDFVEDLVGDHYGKLALGTAIVGGGLMVRRYFAGSSSPAVDAVDTKPLINAAVEAVLSAMTPDEKMTLVDTIHKYMGNVVKYLSEEQLRSLIEQASFREALNDQGIGSVDASERLAFAQGFLPGSSAPSSSSSSSQKSDAVELRAELAAEINKDQAVAAFVGGFAPSRLALFNQITPANARLFVSYMNIVPTTDNGKSYLQLANENAVRAESIIRTFGNAVKVQLFEDVGPSQSSSSSVRPGK